jgi:esterase/lipase superfamily enzyme
MDFDNTYVPVGKRTTFRNLISLIGRYRWDMDNLDVVTAVLNPEIDDDDIYMYLPQDWPEGLNPPKIIVRLRKALYTLKQASQL